MSISGKELPSKGLQKKTDQQKNSKKVLEIEITNQLQMLSKAFLLLLVGNYYRKLIKFEAQAHSNGSQQFFNYSDKPRARA